MSRKRRAEEEEEEDEEDLDSIESEDSLSPDSEEIEVDDKEDDEEEEENEQENEDLVNCDFEFFDPQEQDYLGIKFLLKQLFDTDADSLNLSALTELILAQPLVGTTVKTEGHESDPLSFTTVLNLQKHKENPEIKDLIKYLFDKSTSNSDIHKVLAPLLEDGTGGTGDIGLVLSERIVNMPHAIAGPSYKMLVEEIQWANEDNEPYQFSHLLIFSRAYVEKEAEDEDDVEDDPDVIKPPSKRQKKTSTTDDTLSYFHVEDGIFMKKGRYVSFPFKREGQGQNQDRKFGLLILLEQGEFEHVVSEMEGSS